MRHELGMNQAASAAPRSLEVLNEIEQLQRSLTNLTDSADALFERLNGVQNTTAGGVKDCATASPQPTLCPLANLIRDTRVRVDILNARAIDNRNALEI